MMSPDLTVINPPSRNGDDTAPSDSAGRSGVRRTAPTAAKSLEPPPPQKCPRCDSPNTKFCYYNNYSLTQPRHFCKTCRRYWTKGGALRNVPIGGGCRKNNKVSTKSSSSRLSSSDSKDSAGSSSYSDIGGFKFFNNLSPAMEFQLGGLNSNFTRFQSPSSSGANNNFIHHHQNYPVSFGDVSTAVATLNYGFDLDPNATNAGGYLMGFNYPGLKPDDGNASGFSGGLMQQFCGTTTCSNNNRNNLASIESLSSMNQDLHWKLQQERLAVLFGGGADNLNINNNNINVNNNNNNNNGHQVQKPQPILFENLEINSSKSAGDYQHHHVVGGSGGAVASRNDATTNGSDHGGCIGSLATEWYFDKFSCFAPAVNPTPTTSSSTSNGIQGWNGNFDQYTALP